MLRWIVVLMVGVPLLELYLLLTLGRHIGLGPTVALTVLTGLLGSAMARFEGLRVWREWLRALRELRSPTQGILEGVLILIAGALLITPGVLTDLVGFLLLIPPTRRAAARPLRRWVDQRIAEGRVHLVARAKKHWSRDDAPGVVDTEGEPVRDPSAPSRTEPPRLG